MTYTQQLPLVSWPNRIWIRISDSPGIPFLVSFPDQFTTVEFTYGDVIELLL